MLVFYEIVCVQQEGNKAQLWVPGQLLDIRAAFLFLS